MATNNLGIHAMLSIIVTHSLPATFNTLLERTAITRNLKLLYRTQQLQQEEVAERRMPQADIKI